jgi:RNA polymerase sigma-70 factor (ECF subfamily)
LLETRDGPDLEAVLERARQGERGALEEIYHRFGSRVFVLARYLLGSHEAAEDATSEVFLRVRRSLHQFDGRIPFASWLLRVTSHYCIDTLRRRRRERQLFSAEPPDERTPAHSAETPLEQALFGERRDAVRHAVRQLPDRYRVPLVLRYYGELSYDEIAERLGVERNHIGVLLFRARLELRRLLRQDLI